MHHVPTELDDTLRAFEELLVSIVDLTDYFFLRKEFEKCIYFVIYLFVFKLVCTRWENFIRIGITVLYCKSCRCQLWIWRSQISVLLAPLRFASPVKRHLRPATLQIQQYCYSLNSLPEHIKYVWIFTLRSKLYQYVTKTLSQWLAYNIHVFYVFYM
jgi:hypothetical protein